jgi:hypothetical protein
LDADARRQRARRVEEAKRAEILEAPGMKLPTLTSTHTLSGHRDWINAHLGMSADGHRIITGDDAGQVIVWDLAEKKQISTWQVPGVAWVVSAALSPDGRTALVSQYRRKGGDFNNYPAGLRLFDADTGELKLDILAQNYPDEKNPPYQYQYKYHQFIGPGLVATAFSPDGKLLALGQGGEDGKGQTHLLDVESGKADPDHRRTSIRRLRSVLHPGWPAPVHLRSRHHHPDSARGGWAGNCEARQAARRAVQRLDQRHQPLAGREVARGGRYFGARSDLATGVEVFNASRPIHPGVGDFGNIFAAGR